MKIHFFSEPNLAHKRDFRVTYVLQNLRTTKSVSLIYFLICLAVRIILEIFKSSKVSISHMDEYDMANWISLAVTPVFYIGSVQIIKFYEEDKKYLSLVQLFVLLFALFLVLNTMRATFYSMHNPRNTLVMYMLGLIITGVFFTFEFYETLALTFITGACFMITVPFYQHEFNEIFANDLASFILLSVFFTMSRFSFSYRVDNYLKIKAIEEKNKEIEIASLIKNEILGVVAHDLRNPLSAIQVVASLMEADKNINDDNRENLQIIRLSCEKAANIINDLLETAHNETSGEFELEEAELNQVLLKIVDEWLKNKKEKVDILYYGTSGPVKALVNKEKIQRVMDNLISNAVKFSGPDEHIEVSLKNLDDEVIIEVKDFGMGIPENLLPYIFDRFSKASRRGVRGEESIGLGLSIVRQIVQKHRGEIEVNSTEKMGTTFTIKLKPL
jgi:two-component system sensor histidine kinase VicK